MRYARAFAWLVGAVLLLGSASVASAVNDLGSFCWADNFGGLWKMNLVGFPGSANISVNGVRIANGTCQGVHEQPLSGTVRTTASGAIFGVQSVANESGVCVGVSWFGVMDSSVAQVRGTFRNQAGDEGDFTLIPVPCTAPFDGGGSGASTDPSRVK